MTWKPSLDRHLRSIEEEMKATAKAISILLTKDQDDAFVQLQLKQMKIKEEYLRISQNAHVALI